MLQSLRDHTQGWIAGTIISLLILSFALWGIHSYFEGGGNNNIVATVNGTDISKNELTRASERIRRQLLAQNPQLPQNVNKDVNEKALQSLIEMEVLKQAATSDGYRVTTEQVDRYLETIPEFQVDGKFSINRFQQALAANLLNPTDFINLLSTSLLIEQPRLGLILSDFVLPNEVSTVTGLIYQQRDIQYTIFPFNSQNVVIPEDKIVSYYQTHQEDFKTPELVSISYIELNANNVQSLIKPSDDALKNYYHQNSTLFTKSAQDKTPLPFEQVKEDVKKSYLKQSMQEEFANLKEKLANKTFEHPDSLDSTAKDLGLTVKTTGLFSREQGSSEPITNNTKVRDVAFSNDVLTLNNNSDVITISPDSVIVLRVNKHSLPSVRPLAEVRALIVKQIQLNEGEQLAKQSAEAAKQKLEKGLPIALTWSQLNNLTRVDKKVNPDLVKKAFSLPRPETNKLTYGIVKTDQGYVLIAVKAVKEGSVPQNQEEYKAFLVQAQNNEAALEYELYKLNLLNKAKIKVQE